MTLTEKLHANPELIDELLSHLNQYCCEEFDADYGLPIGAAENVLALRTLVLAWVHKLENTRDIS